MSSKKRPAHSQLNESVENVGDTHPERLLKRKYTRQIKVPYTKKVKVPVTLQKVITVPEVMQVKIKKWVPQIVEEEVEESETVVETRTAYRDKEVWVKSEVTEDYETKVPVIKTRKVMRPWPDVEERDVVTPISVKSEKVSTFEAYRVDELERIQRVEREEFQLVEVYEHAIGERIKGAEREISRSKKHTGRVIGTFIYPLDAKEVADLPDDPFPNQFNRPADIVIGPATSTYGPDAFTGEQEVETEDGLFVDEAPLIIYGVDQEAQSFTIQNISSTPMNLNGWRVHDEAVQQQENMTNLFDFTDKSPDLVLQPRGIVTVWFGKGSRYAREYDNVTNIWWCEREMFLDPKDFAYLVNPSGEIIHRLSLLDRDTVPEQKFIKASFPAARSLTYHHQRNEGATVSRKK